MSAKIVYSPEVAELQHFFQAVAQNGIPQQAVDIYQGRNRVVRFDIPIFGAVNIKAFRIPHIINRIVYGNIRHSKARRAYEFAIRLRKLGFKTPTPLCYIEHRSCLLLGESYFISEQLDGYQDLRNIHTYPDKANLLDQLAKLMVQLHNTGVYMKDFSQGNILWQLNNDGKYDFQLVDINRMEFYVSNHDKLMTNFRAVSDYDDDLRTLAEAYAMHAQLDITETIEQAFRARTNFLHKRQLKQKFRTK